MIHKNKTLALIIISVLMLSAFDVTFAAEKMTYEEYQAQLEFYQSRETKANGVTAEEQVRIEELRAEIKSLEAQIDELWNQIFAELGVTKEEYQAYLRNLESLDRRIAELERLSPDRLLERKDEIDELDELLEEYSRSPIARLSDIDTRLSGMDRRIDRLRSAVPKPRHDSYTVVRGDYLWKISGKDAIYDDPWKWMRIYSANREDINDPDLIYPQQRLTIPRQIGSDQHLVQRGEHLSRIAGYNNVYGDPFQWTKLYQANKTNGFIQDPNVIYPEQILDVPR